MFYLEMDVLCSELTPSLIVIEYKINVTDLDYIELGKRLESTKNVVAIKLIKPLMAMISLFLSLKLSVPKKLMALRRLER